jgi:ABC-type multidrug transport system permease subunit
MWREWISVTRNPADVAGRMLVFCYVGLFMGLIYYDMGTGMEALRARLNVLYAEILVVILLPYVYMSLFTADKQFYIADVNAGLYKPSAYYLAKQLVVLPFAVLNVLMFSFILYGLSGLRMEASAVFGNAFVCIFAYLIAAQVSMRKLTVGRDKCNC